MSATDKLKLWAVAFIVIAIVYVLGYGEGKYSPGVRYGLVVAGITVSALLIVFSQSGRDFSRFMRDAGVELRKVVWPSKQETMRLTGVVFVFLFLMALYLWLADLIIGSVVDLLLN